VTSRVGGEIFLEATAPEMTVAPVRDAGPIAHSGRRHHDTHFPQPAEPDSARIPSAENPSAQPCHDRPPPHTQHIEQRRSAVCYSSRHNTPNQAIATTMV
jgi:hypothetical protein